MIPREIIAAEGDRPSRVGSHYHSNLLRTGTVRLIPLSGIGKSTVCVHA